MIVFGKEYRRPKWIPRWLSIPFVVFAAFILTLLFFGDNNYVKIYRYKQQINQLKTEIKANEDSAAIYDAKIQELHTNRGKPDRTSRQKKGMKPESAEVYTTETH